jgi:hypothetical protein
MLFHVQLPRIQGCDPQAATSRAFSCQLRIHNHRAACFSMNAENSLCVQMMSVCQISALFSFNSRIMFLPSRTELRPSSFLPFVLEARGANKWQDLKLLVAVR